MFCFKKNINFFSRKQQTITLEQKHNKSVYTPLCNSISSFRLLFQQKKMSKTRIFYLKIDLLINSRTLEIIHGFLLWPFSTTHELCNKTNLSTVYDSVSFTFVCLILNTEKKLVSARPAERKIAHKMRRCCRENIVFFSVLLTVQNWVGGNEIFECVCASGTDGLMAHY